MVHGQQGNSLSCQPVLQRWRVFITVKVNTSSPSFEVQEGQISEAHLIRQCSVIILQKQRLLISIVQVMSRMCKKRTVGNNNNKNNKKTIIFCAFTIHKEYRSNSDYQKISNLFLYFYFMFMKTLSYVSSYIETASDFFYILNLISLQKNS